MSYREEIKFGYLGKHKGSSAPRDGEKRWWVDEQPRKQNEQHLRLIVTWTFAKITALQ